MESAPDPPSTRRSSVLVAAGILASRTAGLVREIALAAGLGTGAAADAFRAALRIPQLLQNLLGEGALSAAFIPVYAALIDRGEEREAGRVAGAIGGMIMALTAALVLIGIVLAEPLTTLLAPGLVPEARALAVTLTPIMTAGIGFVVLAAWCLGILNSHRRFFLSYAAPVLWNAAQIAAVVGAMVASFTEAGIARAAAWGVLVGGVAQFLVQVPSVRRVAPDIRLSLDHRNPAVRQILRRFGPAALGRGVIQVGAYVDLFLGSLLVVGSVAVLDFAQILYVLPISLFAISIAAAELPELSRTTDPRATVGRLDGATARVSFLLVGSMVVFVAGGGLLVSAVYQYGAFRADDVVVVWLTLAAYSIGLVPIGAARLLQNGLFAAGDTAGPARVAVARVAVAGVVGVVLMFQFEQFALVSAPDGDDHPIAVFSGDTEIVRVGDLPADLSPVDDEVRRDEDAPPRLGTVGLALGSAVAAWLEFFWLSRMVRRRFHDAPGLARHVLPLVPGAVAAAVVFALGASLTSTMWPPIRFAAVGGVAGLAYVAGALLGRSPSAMEAAASVRSRLGR